MYLPQSHDLVSRASNLIPRYFCNDYGYNYSGGYYNNCNSAWQRWGRWVLAGVLIAVGIIIVLIFACIASRRRRRSRITSTSAPMAYQAPVGNYQTEQTYGNQPAPAYSAPVYDAPQGPPPAHMGGANEGYYGQQSGIQQPYQAYKP